MIPIFIGSGQSRRFRGRTIFFCPVCRELRAFRVREIFQHRHLWWVFRFSYKSIGHDWRCDECGLTEPIHSPDDIPLCTARKADFDTVALACSPRYRLEWKEVLEREKDLHRGRLRVAAVKELVRELMLRVAPAYDERARSVHFNLWSTFALLAAIPVCITHAVLAERHTVPWLPGGGWIAVGPLACGVLTLVLFALDPRRYYRRRIEPLLVRGLAPMQPSAEMLAEVRDELRAGRVALWRRIKPRRLEQRANRAFERQSRH